LLSSFSIDGHIGFLSFEVFNESLKWSIKNMQNAFSYLDGINNFVRARDSSKSNNSSIVLLSSRSWINSRLIKNDNIWKIVLFHVFENFYDSGIEIHDTMIFVNNLISLLQMICVIKNGFLFLGSLLLSEGNFIIQTLWNWLFHNFSNFIGWNTESLHALNPIINCEFSFFLFDNFFKFFYRFII